MTTSVETGTDAAPDYSWRGAGALPSRGSGWKYRARVVLSNPATIIGLALAVLFSYTIIAPVVSLLLSGVQTGYGDQARTGTAPGEFTTYYLERVFSSAVSPIIFWEPLRNTLLLAACSIAGALLIGVPTAWVLARTDVPGRKWFSTALIIPYMLPAWTFALAWTTIFKNRAVGGAQGWLEAAGFSPPDWLAYGPVPIVAIFTLHYTPFVILLVTSAIRNLPNEFDEAAQVLGAGAGTRIRKIALPLLRPSLISAATLILAKVIGEFGVAFVLGTPVGFQVLSTTLYQSIDTAQAGVAAVIAIVMVVIGGVSLWIDFTFLRNMGRFTTVSGRGFSRAANPLRGRKPWAFGWLTALFTISVAFPLFVLFLSTLLRTPGVFRWDNLTFDYWVGTDLPTANFRDGVLINPATWDAAWNTVWMVGVAAILTGLLGMLVGYVVVRSPARWIGNFLRAASFVPYLVPGMAFAVAYLSLFAVQRGPVPALYGTSLILIMAMVADELPFASRAGVSSMMQLGKDSEEAAQVSGARWVVRMRRIVIPIQRSAIASAILLPFIAGVQSLSMVVVLATPGTELLTTLNMGLVESGYTHAANAVVLIICAIALAGTWAARKLFRADLSQGMGS